LTGGPVFEPLTKGSAAQASREIDAILITELSRWGRSTQDLVQTLDDPHSWKVSVPAQTGLSFDLSIAQQAHCAPSWRGWPNSSRV
jgi:hypothetical protein